MNLDYGIPRDRPLFACQKLKAQIRRSSFSALWMCIAWTCIISSAIAQQTQRARLQLINGTDQDYEIFWLKSDTERKSNGIVAAGKEKMISTTVGHRFLLVERSDQSEISVTCEVRIQAFRIGGIPEFYTQSVSAEGFPIVASPRVNPYALKEAKYLVNLMLANRPDVRQAMVQSGSRLCILAWNEFTTDQPEFTRLGNRPPREFEQISGKDYWDARARGLGGSEHDPFCSCGEENLLAYPGDPYSTENILIHELAHNIHLRGMNNIDPTFDRRLKKAYEAAVRTGLWRGKYAGTNHHEYFAEGVQSWFDKNRENDHDHNHVNTRVELIEYDPALAELCREVFGDTELTYTNPTTRLRDHLAGYDPGQAPTFVWPQRLQAASKLIQEVNQERLQSDSQNNKSTEAKE